MDSPRITITINASTDILSAAENNNFQKPCPKSKRKSINGSHGVGGHGARVLHAAVTAAKPPARVAINKMINLEIDGVGETKHKLSKILKAVSVVRRSRSPIRSPMPALPYPPKHTINPAWKKVPPIPKLTVVTGPGMIRLTWDDGISLGSYHLYAAIAGQELFACVFENEANVKWEKLSFIKALPLSYNRRQPISCEMTDLATGVEYYFAVRPVDIYNRRGPFAVVYTRL